MAWSEAAFWAVLGMGWARSRSYRGSPSGIDVGELDQTLALERMRGVNASLLGDVIGRLSPNQRHRARRAVMEMIDRT